MAIRRDWPPLAAWGVGGGWLGRRGGWVCPPLGLGLHSAAHENPRVSGPPALVRGWDSRSAGGSGADAGGGGAGVQPVRGGDVRREGAGLRRRARQGRVREAGALGGGGAR